MMTIKSNILYPKEPTMVECAKVDNLGFHFWIELSDYITVTELEDHEIRFIYRDEHYVYWADMSKFLTRFYTTAEARDKKINEILQDDVTTKK